MNSKNVFEWQENFSVFLQPQELDSDLSFLASS